MSEYRGGSRNFGKRVGRISQFKKGSKCDKWGSMHGSVDRDVKLLL